MTIRMQSLIDHRNKVWRRPHKRADCVSIRQDGKHLCFSCYFHAPSIISWIEQGDECSGVEQWSLPTWQQHQAVCCIEPEEM